MTAVRDASIIPTKRKVAGVVVASEDHHGDAWKSNRPRPASTTAQKDLFERGRVREEVRKRRWKRSFNVDRTEMERCGLHRIVLPAKGNLYRRMLPVEN